MINTINKTKKTSVYSYLHKKKDKCTDGVWVLKKKKDMTI